MPVTTEDAGGAASSPVGAARGAIGAELAVASLPPLLSAAATVAMGAASLEAAAVAAAVAPPTTPVSASAV